MRFGLHMEGLDEMIERVGGLSQQIKLNLTVELEWFGRTATQEMITQHEFINRTGRLERSIGYHIEVVNDHLQLHVYALAPYAVAVEEGVPGHSRPYPYFWPAFYKHLPELMERLDAAVHSALEDASDTGRLDLGFA